MLQFDLQFTVAWVRTVKFISGAFFGRQVSLFLIYLSIFFPHVADIEAYIDQHDIFYIFSLISLFHGYARIIIEL